MHTSTTENDRKYFAHARWHKLPLDSVTLTGGFWANWQNLNRRVTLQHGYHMLEKAGNFDNMRIAAGIMKGEFRGMVFQDTDIYKWLEAVGYELYSRPDPQLQQQADAAIDLIGAAQEKDGYINTYVQIVTPQVRWADLDFGHELYCAGHLFQGAVAYYRATHNSKILDSATRFADLIGATFGPDKRQGACGHPEIEMALVELYRTTGRTAYLDLAKYFIDQRGKGVMQGMGWMKAEYHQDRVPVRQAEHVEGHAVRAMYLNTGVADLYLETGEAALINSLQRQWQDMVEGKIYITGGLGSRYEGEAFGDPYELPPDRCYCETCAAIGSLMWNWRMLMITGESRFADSMERVLYNGILSGLALDGSHFFYMNPLLNRGTYGRQEWYAVACCPPNLMRLLASLGQYFVTTDNTGLQIHLYNTSTVQTRLSSGQPIVFSIQTEYPWEGHVNLYIDQAMEMTWQLRLRLPGWCSSAAVHVNGQPVQSLNIDAGYIVLEQPWKAGDRIELDLEMPPVFIEAHPRVDAVRESVAIQRGPLVYCLESTDHSGVQFMDIQIDPAAALRPIWRDDLVGSGLMTIESSGLVRDTGDWQKQLYRQINAHSDATKKPVSITAIPYYAWANRGQNAMRVWIPRAKH